MNPTAAAAFVYVLIAITVLVLLTVFGAWLWQVGFPAAFDAVRRHFARTEIDDTERTDSGGHVSLSMRIAPMRDGDLSQLDRWDGLGRATRSGDES